MQNLYGIKLVAIDVDGTLTDGHIYMGNEGEAMKAFNVKDGLGIKLLMQNDITPVIITGRQSQIVENRCQEIGIAELYQGIEDKSLILEKVIKQHRLSQEQVAYIGDDMNDLEAMLISGITFAPNDCNEQLLPYVDIHLNKAGGEGAVREAIDMILEDLRAKGRKDSLNERH